MSFDPEAYLSTLADVPDEQVDLAKTALALAMRDQPGLNPDRYINHIQKLAADTAAAHATLLKAGAADDAGAQLAALKNIFVLENTYKGDIETYNDLQNASLIRVIDRRKGLPVALAILYLDTAKKLGWDVAGLDFPGHFMCRLDKDGRRIIFDPFYECKVLEASDLRNFLKQVKGPQAELSVDYLQPATNRGILIRLQNNIKYRQIETEDYPAALKTVEGMRMVDAHEYRLLLDAGVLYARTGKTGEAINVLEDYIKRAPRDRDRHDAAILLQDLKNSPE